MNCTKTKRNNSVAYFCGNCTMCKLPREIVWILINILITSDKYRHGKWLKFVCQKRVMNITERRLGVLTLYISVYVG